MLVGTSNKANAREDSLPALILPLMAPGAAVAAGDLLSPGLPPAAVLLHQPRAHTRQGGALTPPPARDTQA